MEKSARTIWKINAKPILLWIKGAKCKFPFKYKQRLYDTCITIDNKGLYPGAPWCSTQTDEFDNHIEGTVFGLLLLSLLLLFKIFNDIPSKFCHALRRSNSKLSLFKAKYGIMLPCQTDQILPKYTAQSTIWSP